LGATQRAQPTSDYHFLAGRFIDEATLARASAIAARWGVHPHEVMIANGWLDAEDYYRALAECCGTPFKANLPAAQVAPTANTSPRQCLASSKSAPAREASSSRLTVSDRMRFGQCSHGFRPTPSRLHRPRR
jgi:hypothetical protein